MDIGAGGHGETGRAGQQGRRASGLSAGPGDITARAATFLSLLDDEARGRATYDLAHEERVNWAFTPVSRNGLPLKDMTLEQRSRRAPPCCRPP